MIFLAAFWAYLRFKKKESFRMREHGLASWNELVATWGVIIFLGIWGLIIILRNL